MRIAWCLLWVALLAGCSTTSPEAGPEAPVAAEVTQSSAEDATHDGPVLTLQDCMGVTVWFYFDGAVAEESVPAPFTPVVTFYSPTGGMAAYGTLVHRTCQASLGGNGLGAVAMAFGGADVRVPSGMSDHTTPVYLFRLVVDHPALVDHFVAQGLPAELGDAHDGSTWMVGYLGQYDSRMGGDRIVASVAENDIVSSSEQSHEFFHLDTNITRWSFTSSASAGDLAESVLELDAATWGYPASANLYFSQFRLGEAMQGHEFTWFEP